MYSAKIQQQQVKIDSEFVPTIISEFYFSTKKELVDLILLQSVKLSTTWPGGTPRPSPAALPRISTIPRRVKLKSLFQCQIKRKSKNKGTIKDTVQFYIQCNQQIKIVMALLGNQNDN